MFSLPDYGYGSLGGCLGINCGHYRIPFVVDVNYKPESGFLENSTVIWKLPKKTFEEKTKKLYNKGVKENGVIHGQEMSCPEAHNQTDKIYNYLEELEKWQRKRGNLDVFEVEKNRKHC